MGKGREGEREGGKTTTVPCRDEKIEREKLNTKEEMDREEESGSKEKRD